MAEPELESGGFDVTHQRPMLDHYALWRACRSGRVNDVGEILSAGYSRGIGSAVFADSTPIRIQTNNLGRSEERRVGKSVDLGGRRIIKKKKTKSRWVVYHANKQ